MINIYTKSGFQTQNRNTQPILVLLSTTYNLFGPNLLIYNFRTTPTSKTLGNWKTSYSLNEKGVNWLLNTERLFSRLVP